MKIEELVLGIENCPCGLKHTCPIKSVLLGAGAIDKISGIADGYKSILLVADENTYRAAGIEAEAKIEGKIKGRIIFEGDKILIPNEVAIERIKAAVPDGCDLILAVGSGVINDLSKYVSFTLKIPYFIVATAPSMDGYASRGAALILGGMKVTLNAHVPEAIIADTDVLKNAPMEMILSGYGDVIGKYSCLADWKLSAIVNGEYLCGFVMENTYEEIRKTRNVAKGLLTRDAQSVQTLMEALIAVGILMAYVGNSRPASGSEHHFSHFFEIVGIVKGEKYLPHGTDVFYSAAETARIREAILSLSKEQLFATAFKKEEYEEQIHRIYGPVGDEVISLQTRLGWYSEIEKRVSVYKERYDEIRSVLSSVPSFSDMCSMLSEVGMDYSYFKELYGEEKICDAYLYAKDLKDRYTVLWMYFDLFDALKIKL